MAAEKKGDPNRYSSRRWLPISGMGSLLNYIQSRSIKIGILQPPDLHASYSDGDIKEYDKQLADVNFDFVFNDGGGGEETVEGKIDEAMAGLGIPKREVRAGA